MPFQASALPCRHDKDLDPSYCGSGWNGPSTASETYRLIARQICDSFYDWITSVLIVEKDEERAPMAALAFATIEGFVSGRAWL
ncbi:MAG: hypothetical protein IPN58_15595 [Anaerolineales bacterium]|nr:hypothetical protein [Anaerolineales bacterium]